MRQAIDAILAGKKPETATTRPFGCSTKWSWKRGSVTEDNAKWAALPVAINDLDQKMADSLASNNTDKLRLINFWSTACAPCIAEFPDLVETYRRFQNRPFELITISVDPVADKSQVLKILTEHQAAISPRSASSLKKENRSSNNYIFTGENLDHLADSIDSKWNGALPYSILVAPGGEIIWRHSGRINAVELRRAIVNYMDKQAKH